MVVFRAIDELCPIGWFLRTYCTGSIVLTTGVSGDPRAGYNLPQVSIENNRKIPFFWGVLWFFPVLIVMIEKLNLVE